MEVISARTVPPLAGVLETVIYVDDLERAHRFYHSLLGLRRVLESPRMSAYAVAPAQMLLVFRRGASTEDLATAGGLVPGHGSEGPAHFAFAIEAGQFEPWKAYLKESGADIVSEVTWAAGGRSLYFRDPDGHVVELATPGLWPGW